MFTPMSATYQTVYGFQKEQYSEQDLAYLTLNDCEELYKEGKCDKLFITEFLHHLNEGCIPVESQCFILR